MSGETKQRIGDLEAEIARLKSLLDVVKISREYSQVFWTLHERPTIRDQFAMAAMHVAGANTAWQRPIDAVEVSRTAYAIADAMMKERDKNGE